jgi:hypothetical protein
LDEGSPGAIEAPAMQHSDASMHRGHTSLHHPTGGSRGCRGARQLKTAS